MAICIPLVKKRTWRTHEVILTYAPSKKDTEKFMLAIHLRNGKVLWHDLVPGMSGYELPPGIKQKHIKQILFVDPKEMKKVEQQSPEAKVNQTEIKGSGRITEIRGERVIVNDDDTLPGQPAESKTGKTKRKK